MPLTEQEQLEQVERYVDLLQARLDEQVRRWKRWQTLGVVSLLAGATGLVLCFVALVLSEPVAIIIIGATLVLSMLGALTALLVGWRVQTYISHTTDRLRSLKLQRELQFLRDIQEQVTLLAKSLLAQSDPEKLAMVSQVMTELSTLAGQLAIVDSTSTADSTGGRTNRTTHVESSSPREDPATTSRTVKLLADS